MKGSLIITRVTSNQADDTIRIRLTDESSHTLFLDAELSLVDFALAITGRGDIPCEFELRGLENVGKRRETKQELIRVADRFFPSRGEAAAREALIPYEGEGWRGQVSDMLNPRCRVTSGDETFQRVQFSRFVEDLHQGAAEEEAGG